jgi:hypothetical protein
MRRSRYLREHWHWYDLLAVLSCVSLIVVATLARRYALETLVYVPLPKAILPSFRVWSIGIVMLQIVPAIIVAILDHQAGHMRTGEGETRRA